MAEPGSAPDAWKPERLEHGFAVQADLPDGPVVLTADEYPGGRLDWHAFRADAGTVLGDPAAPRPRDELVRTLLPAPVSYRGMPADRFWEIEDAPIRFGELTTGRTDLARLLLAEFALTYGNDWFVVPIDLPVGSIANIDALDVTDTFGETTAVPAAADEAPGATATSPRPLAHPALQACCSCRRRWSRRRSPTRSRRWRSSATRWPTSSGASSAPSRAPPGPASTATRRRSGRWPQARTSRSP